MPPRFITMQDSYVIQPRRRPFNAVRAIELACSLILIALGLTLFEPAETFQRCASWSVFRVLGTENQWGCAFLTSGMLGLMATFTQRPYQRCAGILLMATTFGIIAGFFAVANLASPGWSMLLILAGLAYYTAYRLVRP